MSKKGYYYGKYQWLKKEMKKRRRMQVGVQVVLLDYFYSSQPRNK
jgi:hypothetical protein